MKIKLFNNNYFPITNKDEKEIIKRRGRVHCYQINCFSDDETENCTRCIFKDTLGNGIKLNKLDIIY